MDRFTFKQIMIIVCTLALIALVGIGMLLGNRSTVTLRVCETDTPCAYYTVETQNTNLGGEALSELAEKIITGIREGKP